MFISYKEINANPKYFKQSPKKVVFGMEYDF